MPLTKIHHLNQEHPRSIKNVSDMKQACPGSTEDLAGVSKVHRMHVHSKKVQVHRRAPALGVHEP